MIVCAGAIGLDTTHTPFKTAKGILGGSSSYFGVAASFFTKTPPALVSAVGSDFPEEYWNALKKHCDLSGVEKLGGKTFSFESRFDSGLQNRRVIGLDEGAFARASWSIPRGLEKPDFLFLNTHHPKFDLKILSRTKAKAVFCDTIEHLVEKQKPSLLEVLKKSRGFFLNEVEARLLSGERDLRKAGTKIQELGPEIAVVKQGGKGGKLFYGDEVFSFPAFPVKSVVDTTGAGDAFAGGFVGWLDKQKKIDWKTLKEACSRGTVMASFCIEAFGLNGLLILGKRRIEERLKEYKQLVE